MADVEWNKELKPLLRQYRGRKHPLGYDNPYQLLVMVVLSAQDSDRHINALAPELFKALPNMTALAKTGEATLLRLLKGVRGVQKKVGWLKAIAANVKQDSKIPTTLEGLTALPGIGRKSANVILRELGQKAEGIMVDLHVVRVAPRLGIVDTEDPKKIEQQMMELLDQKSWGEVGMAMSFLGREICRPKDPKHAECVMNKVCAYCLAKGGVDG